MLASVLKRKCGSIWACSASMRASSTVRPSCSVSARCVAWLAVNSALRLPPATTLMMNEATMSRKASVGSLNMPPMIRLRNDTSSSAFHDTTATQSKKPHHITTMPRRISRKVWRIPMGREAGPLGSRAAALSVPGLRWSVFTFSLPSGCLAAKGQDYGRSPPGSSVAGQNARRQG